MNKEYHKSIKQVLKDESKAILEIMDNYDKDAVEKIIKEIINCKGKIIASGCGTSAEAARKIVHTLSCIECPAFFMDPSDALHGGLGVVQKSDLVIFLSKGGETFEINSMIGAVKKKEAVLIGVTENEKSSLAKKSDIFLQVKISKEPDDFNMLATGSILALLSLFDAITITVMREKKYKKEQFGLIHPGGAVGKKLTGKTL